MILHLTDSLNPQAQVVCLFLLSFCLILFFFPRHWLLLQNNNGTRLSCEQETNTNIALIHNWVFFSFSWYKHKENEGQPESAGRWRQPAGRGCCQEDSESGRRLKAPAAPPGLRSPRTDQVGCTHPTPGRNLHKESRRREKQGRRCEVRLDEKGSALSNGIFYRSQHTHNPGKWRAEASWTNEKHTYLKRWAEMVEKASLMGHGWYNKVSNKVQDWLEEDRNKSSTFFCSLYWGMRGDPFKFYPVWLFSIATAGKCLNTRQRGSRFQAKMSSTFCYPKDPVTAQ